MPALTLTQAVTEMQERGFGGLPPERLERMLRVEYEQICELQPWPWLLDTAEGTAPLGIADLRTVESVVDQTNGRKLLPEDYRNLSDRHPGMSATGAPSYYWVEWSEGTPTVRTYPLDPVTLTVRYYRVPPTWTSSDQPLVPAQYRDLIVDRAVARALRDAGQWEAAQAAKAIADDALGVMVQRMFGSQADRPIGGQVIDRDAHGDWT